MILCTRCGFQNEDTDTFCGSCAGFLEWSGEKVGQEAPEAAEPAPDPTPAPEVTRAPTVSTGFIERVKDRMGMSDGGPVDGAATAEGPGPEHGPTGPADPDACRRPRRQPPPRGSRSRRQLPSPPLLPWVCPPQDRWRRGRQYPVPLGPLLRPRRPQGRRHPPAQLPRRPRRRTSRRAASPRRLRPVQPWPATVTAAAAGSAVDSPPDSSRPVAGVARTTGSPEGTGPTAPVVPSPTPGATARVEPTAMQPEAVKPAATRARPGVSSQDCAGPRIVNPGDLVCGQCGEGNDPSRRFCRRCGASLAAGDGIRPLPWYQRWWRS